MIVQVQKQQVRRMTTTPTRWRVKKVNRNNNKKEETKILSCFLLFSYLMSYLTFVFYAFDSIFS